jgi:CRISPR/Cas system endoribonuclease Cas6 (RAMP superfamily)|tara:strand:+ start:266 stop:472 length:207 start_codon:yes stop_codon:yes gene_type:complete
MKNTISTVKNKISAKLFSGIDKTKDSKSTDVNILLNRVRLNQKSESRKKIYFSTAASTALILFGFLIF